MLWKTRSGALHELLCSLFTTNGLRRWVVYNIDERLDALLPGDDVPLSEMATEATSLLIKHGRVDDDFFAKLITDYRRRESDIVSVKRRFTGGSSEGTAPLTSIRRLRAAVFVLLVPGLLVGLLVLLRPKPLRPPPVRIPNIARQIVVRDVSARLVPMLLDVPRGPLLREPELRALGSNIPLGFKDVEVKKPPPPPPPVKKPKRCSEDTCTTIQNGLNRGSERSHSLITVRVDSLGKTDRAISNLPAFTDEPNLPCYCPGLTER